jgi:hypothetical protein
MPRKGLTIWVPLEWMTHPALLSLAEAGHQIAAMPNTLQPDLILAPESHGWREEWLDEKHLKLALTWARKRKKEESDGNSE